MGQMWCSTCLEWHELGVTASTEPDCDFLEDGTSLNFQHFQKPGNIYPCQMQTKPLLQAETDRLTWAPNKNLPRATLSRN